MDYKGLTAVFQEYPNPEDINNHPDTAPSVRLKKLIPGYNKVVHGVEMVKAVGMEDILAKCPRFRKWVEDMKAALA